MTGIYPLTLERALKREGVREAPDIDVFRDNIATSQKRKRESINGMHLNSEEQGRRSRLANLALKRLEAGFLRCRVINANIRAEIVL